MRREAAPAQQDKFRVLISGDTFAKIHAYHQKLKEPGSIAGKRLEAQRQRLNKKWSDITTEELIQLIVDSKKPVIFGEAAIVDQLVEEKNWNDAEYAILAGINFSVPNVKANDNGVRGDPKTDTEFVKFKKPIDVELM